MRKHACASVVLFLSVLWMVPLLYAQDDRCIYSISPTSQTLMADGGSGSVQVRLIVSYPIYPPYPFRSCTWSAISNVNWITITEGANRRGSGVVSFSVLANTASTPRTGTLNLAGHTFTVTQEGASESSVFVPIVLSATGSNNSFFSSQLVLTNRGGMNASVEFNYTAAFGGGSGTAFDSLPARKQLTISDAIAYLRSKGIPIPASGNRGGTLEVTFSGISSSSDAAVAVSTMATSAEGHAGLAYQGIPTAMALTGPSYLCGLRQDSKDRSNVALQNVATRLSEGQIVLRLTVYSGDPSTPFTHVLPDVRLSPGGFKQISQILKSNGISLTNGYVRVQRVSGTAPYYAYGIINDQVNSDGSFVPPVPEDLLAGRTGLTLPVVVETSAYSTELILANWSASQKTLRFTYVAEAIQAPGSTASFSVTLKPGEQSIVPNFLQVLRERRIAGVESVGPAYMGALFATVVGGDGRGIFMGARTSTPGGGGRYGLFYVATPYGMASTTGTWVFGLRQDAISRTNLALVNTGETDGTPDIFNIELFDGDTGLKVNTIEGVTLKSKGWMQIGTILAHYARGTTQGYARVTRTGGSNPFIAYAVINDGSRPGERTGDGAFVSSSP